MISPFPTGSNTLTRVLAATCGILVFTLALATESFACHKGTTHGKDKLPCPPGDALPGESWNIAYFDDQFIRVFGAQDFQRTATSTAVAGDYLAAGPMSEVEIATDQLSKQASKKQYADLCHAMDRAMPIDPKARGPFVGVPDEFSYGWTGDCMGDSCMAQVSLTFQDGVAEFFDGVSDVMNIQMEAQIAGPAGDHDPFLESQAIGASTWGVLEMRATFNRIGTSRTLFECVFRQQGYGGPIFHTEPIPEP